MRIEKSYLRIPKFQIIIKPALQCIINYVFSRQISNFQILDRAGVLEI